ncbi:MAG: glutamate--tRNA ligase [Patescibacteria group bacterium]
MVDTAHDKKIVTRFAPSPTGFMHVGNLRTGLFAWLWARKNNGTFILRIEDTDKKREVEGSLEHIKKSLRWIGMNWDEGPDIDGPHAPYIQSERISKLHIYQKYAEKLIEKGFAYADPSTEEEIDKLRKLAEAEKRPFLYREHRPENPIAWQEGIPLRFKISELKRTVWHDAVRGELSAGPEALDDFILIKSDGYPTYNFAHIVDDIEMNVTHVVRGQEFISSTPNYIAVYEALGATQPLYVTAPPIMGEEGNKKMGKRDGAKDVLEYEKEGYLPETMLNFLAFLGWNPGGEKEVFTVEELIHAFDISKIQKSGAQFNEEKLDWLNKEHMKRMPESKRNEEITLRLKMNYENQYSDKFTDTQFLVRLLPTIFDRISKWGDIDTLVAEKELDYFFAQPDCRAEKLIWKDSNQEDAAKHLAYVSTILENAPEDAFESVEKIKPLIFDYATEHGRGNVLWPLRVSLSGRDKSPDPFTLIYILGKDETLGRIAGAIQKLS